ncbi:hypothetical protein FOZ62_030894, partial [Perkinsus olseni]
MLGMLTLKPQGIASVRMTRAKRRRSVVERHIVESEQQKQEIHELQLTVTNLREQLKSCTAIEGEVIAGAESGTAGSQQEAGSAYQEVEKLVEASGGPEAEATKRELENANIQAVAEKEKHAKAYKVEGLRRQVQDMDRAKIRLADQETQLDDSSVEIAALRQELEAANEVKAEQGCRIEAACEEKKQLRQEIEELRQTIRPLKAKCVQGSEADKRLQEISKQLEEKSTSLRVSELLIDVLRKETERSHQLR